MSKYAWVTLATNDSYSLGALVLANSLKRVSTAHQLAILITPGVSESMQNKLRATFNVVQEVNVMDSQDAANLALLARPELGITFTKLHCWRLVQFEKCVFLDADVLVLKNCDELFEREELSAAPDVGWPDCFNSGVFVYRPNLETFSKITQFALEKGSFDGGDQGLLNLFFSDWAHKDISKHLPFSYNTCSTATYSYLPAFKQFAHQIKILHFIGTLKPWLLNFNSQSKYAYVPQEYGHLGEYLQLWWNIFCDNVHPNLSEQMSYSTTRLENLRPVVDSAQFSSDTVEDRTDLSVYIVSDPWDNYYQNLDNLKNAEKDYAQTSSEENTKYTNQLAQTNGGEMTSDIEIHSCISHTPQQADMPNKCEENLDLSQGFLTDHQCETFDASLSSYQFKEDTQSSENIQTVEVESKEESLNVSKSSEDNLDDRLNVSNLDHGRFVENRERSTLSTPFNEEESGLAGALAKLKLGEPRSAEQEEYEQHIRRQCWESGNIDYTGRDSFDNIWRKITETLDSAPKPKPAPKVEAEKPAKKLTSADIEDGKVEYDAATNSTTVYKHIPGGYEMHITMPQPNGTTKTQTKTFYDPVPVTQEELAKQKKQQKTKKTDDNTTVVIKKIPGGHEEITTITHPDGTTSTQTKTIYDAEEVEETETTETKEQKTSQKNLMAKKQQPPQPKTKAVQRVDTEEESSTTEYNIKSQKKVEEVRRYSESTEISGKSTKTKTKKNPLPVEYQKVLGLTDVENSTTTTNDDSTTKKKKKSKKVETETERIDENTVVMKKRVPGGTEFIYTKTLEDGTSEISTKTVYEQVSVEMTEEEIEEYEMQKKQAEKLKKSKKTKLPSQAGTKQIIPSENPGDVTTLETIKIEGGTEYHYTTVRPDGTVKKSSKTVYDPVPVEGEDDEEEIIEEYEEEIIEPGEPVTKTITTTKTLPPKTAKV